MGAVDADDGRGIAAIVGKRHEGRTSLALQRHPREAVGDVEDEPLFPGGYDVSARARRDLLGGRLSVIVGKYSIRGWIRRQSLTAALNSKDCPEYIVVCIALYIEVVKSTSGFLVVNGLEESVKSRATQARR